MSNKSGKKANMPKIVVIGGGTGLSVMLRGLKKYDLDLTAIVTVADDGGSSGILRTELNMLPPGDIRNVIISLADTEPLLEMVLQHRFTQGEGLAGHNLGNLLIAAMQEITGDFVSAIKELSRVLAVKGSVLPASLQTVNLTAEFEDGTIVTGESNIPKVGKKIKRVFLEPTEIEALDEAVESILQADAIIIGPGSLYTSIIPNLLVSGIKEAVLTAKGKKIYIANVMTQPGETDDFTVIDHIKAIEDHIGRTFIDIVVVNQEEVEPGIIKQYRDKGANPVKPDIEKLDQLGYQVIADRFLTYHTYLRHDPKKLSEKIISIIMGLV